MRANVVRIHRVRWRIGQALLPAAVVTSILARHGAEPRYLWVPFAIQVLALAAFLSARRSLGEHELQVQSKCLSSERGLHVVLSAVTAWTLEGSVIRIDDPSWSWHLRARDAQSGALSSTLARALGRATRLRRRGSGRARLVAGAVSIGGFALTTLAISLEQPLLALLGTPPGILGLAALGALSQKIPVKRHLRP